MTMQAAQEFYKASNSNQELIAKLLEGATGPEDFIHNTVTEGNRQGYEFTGEEATQFLKGVYAAAAKADAGGELSDLELEMVAGGKKSSTRSNSYLNAVSEIPTENELSLMGSKIGAGLKSALSTQVAVITGWFSGDFSNPRSR